MKRLSTWSTPRLKKAGYCVTDLKAFWLQTKGSGSSFRSVASFLVGAGINLPDHRLTYVRRRRLPGICRTDSILDRAGTQVLVSRLDPLKEEPLKGSVVGCDPGHIHVSFESESNELEDGVWRLDHTRSDIAYERMKDAVKRMHHQPALPTAVDSANDNSPVVVGTHLRDILLRSFQPAEDQHAHVHLQNPSAVGYPSHELDHDSDGQSNPHTFGAFKDQPEVQDWAIRYSKKNPVVKDNDPKLEGVNNTQRKAMAYMIGQRLSLVQGVRSFLILVSFFLSAFLTAAWDRENQDDCQHYQAAEGLRSLSSHALFGD
jgi:hypothetical protein